MCGPYTSAWRFVGAHLCVRPRRVPMQPDSPYTQKPQGLLLPCGFLSNQANQPARFSVQNSWMQLSIIVSSQSVAMPEPSQ